MADKKFKEDLKSLPQTIGNICAYIGVFIIVAIIISPIIAPLVKLLTICFGFFWNLI